MKQKKFASKAEERFADALTNAGIPWKYETIRIPWVPDVCYYTPDFCVNNKYIEYKGYFRPSDRAMLKCVKAQHPDIKIHLLFQKPNNKLHPSSKTTYKDWAEKHGFTVITEQDVLSGDF